MEYRAIVLDIEFGKYYITESYYKNEEEARERFKCSWYQFIALEQIKDDVLITSLEVLKF